MAEMNDREKVKRARAVCRKYHWWETAAITADLPDGMKAEYQGSVIEICEGNGDDRRVLAELHIEDFKR
jgi:hypothetical protein